MIKFTTNHGDILIDLNEEKAPVSCENFKQYVTDGHYDGTIFHRVIKGFMIQGGGFMPDMMQKATRDNIENGRAISCLMRRGAQRLAPWSLSAIQPKTGRLPGVIKLNLTLALIFSVNAATTRSMPKLMFFLHL